jgi:DNA-binding NarL/FixJ family response regulator
LIRPKAAREAEVLCLLSKGQPNKIIAHRLDLAESTIKLHIHHIISKLGVSNRTEAAIVFHASSGTVNVREGNE